MAEAQSSLITDKTALRRIFRAARARFVTQSGEQASMRLSFHIQRLINDLGPELQVALYRPLSDEANFDLEGEFYYPRVRGDHEMDFWKPAPGRPFLVGAMGIQEPDTAGGVGLDLNRPALVCCPAVAVDWSGRRLGQGQGYYDRFFAAHPKMLRVGVVYQVQVTKDRLPADSWDQPLDWIVTEEMILRTSNRSP